MNNSVLCAARKDIRGKTPIFSEAEKKFVVRFQCFIRVAVYKLVQMSQIDTIALLQQLIEQAKVVELDNKRLKQLVAIQESVIEEERATLREVAATTRELMKVEAERAKLRAQLGLEKSDLLVACSGSHEVENLVEKSLESETGLSPISATPAGRLALAVVEKIQGSIMALTQLCLKSEDLSVSQDALTLVIEDVNQMIDDAVNSGIAKESPQDTIRRQAFVITSVMPPEDEE